MARILDWFSKHPVLTALLALEYFVAVSISHDQVQDFAYWLQRTFGKGFWNPFVALLGVAALALLGWRAARALRGSPVRRAAATAWWATFAGIGLAGGTLLATNMEAIHFPQYALLFFPLYALTRRFGWAVLLTTLLGALDELHQFSVLHAGWAVNYDLNDVLLNALGAGLAAACVAVFAPVRRPSPPRPWAELLLPLVLAAVLMPGAAVGLGAAGRLAAYREDQTPRTLVLLSRGTRPETRWSVPDWGRGYYQLHPAAGAVLVLLVCAGYAALDRRIELPYRSINS